MHCSPHAESCIFGPPFPHLHGLPWQTVTISEAFLFLFGFKCYWYFCLLFKDLICIFSVVFCLVQWEEFSWFWAWKIHWSRIQCLRFFCLALCSSLPDSCVVAYVTMFSFMLLYKCNKFLVLQCSCYGDASHFRLKLGIGLELKKLSN